MLRVIAPLLPQRGVRALGALSRTGSERGWAETSLAGE